MNRFRSWLSDWLEGLALKIAPEDEIIFTRQVRQVYETPPLNPESNARTKKTKAKRKRRLAKWRALEAAQKLERRDA